MSAATPRPPEVRESSFGQYVDLATGDADAILLVVNRGAGREATGRIRLPHQLYLRDLQALMAEPGMQSVEVLPYRTSQLQDVSLLRALDAASQQEEG